MSVLGLTYEQWLRVEQLEKHVELVWAADAKFFKTFPHRKHFVRLSAPAELEQQAILDGGIPEIPRAHRFVTIVRHVRADRFLRVITDIHKDADIEMGETFACLLFVERATSEVWEAEKLALDETAGERRP